MSRAQYKVGDYTVAFGVDHTPMGAFWQVFKNGECVVEGDALFGVQVHEPELFDPVSGFPDGALKFVAQLREAWSPQTCNFTEEQVIGLAKTFGPLPDGFERKVRELWD